jgi:hypothetical protein
MSIQTINAGVVERARINEDVRIAISWKLPQNLRQGLLAQLGCSPSAGRQRRQFTDPFARHECSPPFIKLRVRERGRVLRRGQESNLPRLLRTDNGFEDREDHQAPFTLREEEKENAQLSTSGIQRPIAEEEKDDRLFNFFKRADDGVEVGPIAGVEFGMEQFAIGANFKSAAARRNERERFDAFAEFKNFGRQTDGLRRVVSNDAIFDRDFGLHPASSFPMKMVRKSRERVKVRAALAF